MNRAGGRVVARGDGGDPFVGGTLWDTENGAALQITSLVRLPGSIRHDSPPAEPNFSSRGRGFVRARRVCARPSMLTPRPSGGASGEVRQGQHGLQRSRARRLMAVVSAHCR